MKFEEEIFDKYTLIDDKLIKFGFQKSATFYEATFPLAIENFSAIIRISLDSKVDGSVIDNEFQEEYTLFRVTGSNGNFVGKIKEAYQELLLKIRDNCFTSHSFSSPQANRISEVISEIYSVSAEFLFDKFPDFGVFRNPDSKKWFALIMNIDKSKLIPGSNGKVEIMNIKLDELVNEYISLKGVYPCYHMSRKNWVTLVLDETLADDKILELIKISYDKSFKKKARK